MKPALWNPVRRILLTLPVIWVVVSVVFLLIHLVPGDPIVQMLGEGANAADISALRQRGVLVHPTGPQTIRACTHLDVSAAQAERVAETIRQTAARPAPARR